MKSVAETLRQLGACGNEREWLQPEWTAEQAYAECIDAQQLMWLAGRLHIERKIIVLAAYDIAETTLRHVPAGEERPRIAIETARRWTRGEATIEEVRAARRGVWATSVAYASYAARAACAADAARAADAAAASAAARGGGPAADAAAYAADTAAYAAYASYAASSAADAADARQASLRASADIVRRHIPYAMIADALERVTREAA